MKIEQKKVGQLLSLCDDGVFAVPEIQRDFVWDSKRAANLLDSIYRGLPIGNILVWKAPSKFRYYLRKAAGALPACSPKCREIWYLIDGQQRLAVLYQTHIGGSIVNSYDRVVDFRHICFALDRHEEQRFQRMRNPIQGEFVRASDVLAHNWRRRIRDLPAYKQNQVDACRRRLLEYRVPVLFMQAKKPEPVRETFLRINSGGMRVSTADIAFTRAARLDLKRLVNELRSALPHGFALIERRSIQFAASLMLGLREIRGGAIAAFLAKKEPEFIVDRHVSDEFTRAWAKIDESVKKAVDYLTGDIGVLNYDLLPSDTMLVTLAYFFYANDCNQPTGAQGRQLNRWFWATAVRGRYSGRGYFRNILADVRYFDKLAKMPSAKFHFTDRMTLYDLAHAEYRGSASLTTAFFLLLCKQRPLYLENARPIPLGETASVKNRKDKHHIFPKALLRRVGFSDLEADRLCNICFMVAEDNQAFGSKRPRQYLDALKKRRHFSRVMRSHLIPHYKASGLWDQGVKRGYKRFIEQRAEFIARAFENQAGKMKLFRKD